MTRVLDRLERIIQAQKKNHTQETSQLLGVVVSTREEAQLFQQLEQKEIELDVPPGRDTVGFSEYVERIAEKVEQKS